MNALLKPLTELQSFNSIANTLKENKKTVLATNVIDSQKIHLSVGLQNQLKKKGLYITHSEVRAKEIYQDLKYFYGDKVKYYPSKDILFYNADVRSQGLAKERFEVIERLVNDEDMTIVLSIDALFDKFIKKDKFKEKILNIKVGNELLQETLARDLIFLGYERVELVEGYGQFAMRGGIVDVFPINLDYPIRIEFWGDEVDSIRLVDAISQRSIEKIDNTNIIPLRELVYGEDELAKAIIKIKKELDKSLKNHEKKGLQEEADNLNTTFSEVIEKLENFKTFNGVEKFSNYFYDKSYSLLDYIDDDYIVFLDEPNRVNAQGNHVLEEFNESIKNRILKGYILPSGSNMVFSYAEILAQLDVFQKVLLTTMTQSIKDFTVSEIGNFMVKSASIGYDNLDLFVEDLKYFSKSKYRIAILSGSKTRGQRLLRELSDKGLSCSYLDDLDNDKIKPSIVSIASGSLTKSFEYTDMKFIVFSDKELFYKEGKKKKRRKKTKGTRIESFTDLKLGDYIVHENHGIGIYRGIEKIISDNISKDYLKLSYKDGGNLYIPTNQMDLIQKYIGGGDGAKVKLNKLGGADWGRTKQRAKGQVAIIAKDLLVLYAKRQANVGYPFSKDTVWQQEFEDLFPYDETDDQIQAISDVKKDMESQKVMDRLICGDVGYGKTEIALRAAFKAVQDGKQVAYLVPTTILAQQHFNTFMQRMSDFPVNVELLSRFRSAGQQKKTIEGLNRGSVDIVIGTHRILSKDIKFKDLGLIIIDEEQRFGVAQKEKLKNFKANTDVLALSATPIPRTLHMSLTGIRDISTLEEPPEERLPVQTYVMEYNDEFVTEAVNREAGRGGQVFYLHNRVKNIAEVASKVQKLAPDVSVAYAHGQMAERELESIMLSFIEGEIDVLVCTTIIETGLDISNANTIVIQDADYMGLSQLYQLRGRVGRSSRTAYAYLMYRKDKVLNEIAEKRLQTIREFTEFGAGFKIAMRDLEIRGAGNLLGAEQHGYMDSVGYDMYCKLLDEEIRLLRGEKVVESFETSIEISIDAYIPNYYIKNEVQKLEIYKKISFIQSQDDLFEVQDEIEDRYGDLPNYVQNLLDIAMLKALAHNKDIVSIGEKNNQIIITFKPDAEVSPTNITKLVTNSKGEIKLTAQVSPYITYKPVKEEFLTDLNKLQEIVNAL